MRRLILGLIMIILAVGLLTNVTFMPRLVYAEKKEIGTDGAGDEGMAVSETTNLYLVKEGDTLARIALRYSTNPETLAEINGITDGLVKQGQYLFLPGVPVVTPWNELPVGVKTKPFPWQALTKDNELMLVVDKSDRTLSIFAGTTLLKSYSISLGDGGLKDKNVAGDHRTPEGRFYVSEKLILDPPDGFLGTRWLRLSYPMPEDAERGLEDGLIDETLYQEILAQAEQRGITPQRTPLGGGIGIHGGTVPEFEPDWTYGCVGLTNADVEEFYDLVQVGTPVVIVP